MNSAETIDSTNLRTKLDSETVTLIDVRLDGDFETGRIPGAGNNCVFEVAFLDRMEEAWPNRSATVCVYGTGSGSHESRMAAEKLTRAGYENVLDFRAGLAGWKAEGFPIENETPASESSPTIEGERTVDLQESRIEWVGRNLLNKHWGKIGLKSGSLNFDGTQLTGGECLIDMNAISCDDLADSPAHDILINHLKNDDFFDVERYPEGRLKIRSAEPIEGALPGSPNYRVTADLTLKGITAPLEFPIAAGITEDGKAAAQASFSIDRTRWNVLYGSGKFFTRLAGHLVNDEIDLQLRIVTA